MNRRDALQSLAAPLVAQAAQDYVMGPDSQRQEGVPKGTVTRFTWNASKIFPGTQRDWWIYVPAQYKADAPAALMVFQDGGGYTTENGAWRVPVVFDNLIHKGEMPVTIGVFVNPGVMPARSENQQARYNRSYEYDAIGERYARFLLDEILPEVRKQYNVTTDPNLRAICGSSSGGICALNAAWNRPDAFRRVLCTVGSYTNLRGGNVYSSLIRKTEPKPLRIFLQDGDHDLNIYSGNWWMANQDMASALEYAGYDFQFAKGHEGHNSKHGGAILPDALRWLWKDSSKPVPVPKGGAGERQFSVMITEYGKGWEMVSSGHRFTEGPAVDKNGEIYFTDIPNNRIHRIAADGKVSVFQENTKGANGLMFGADGKLYAGLETGDQLVAYTMDGKSAVLVDGIKVNDVAVTSKNEIYFTEPVNKRVWYLDAKGNKRVVHEGLLFPNGVLLSPDQSLLFVADSVGRYVWSFQIAADGSLENGQAFYRLEITDESIRSGADGMTVDTEGHVYVASSAGVQICDQAGRVVAILAKPQPGSLSNVVFGGPDLKTLYVTAGDKVFRRPLQRQGVVSWNLVKPPQPRL